MDNALILSLKKGELWKFIIGEDPYFYEAKCDNEEPQNIEAAFSGLVLKVFHEEKSYGWGEFFDGLREALVNSSDKNKAIYAVVDWLWNYFNFCKSVPCQPSDFKELMRLQEEIKASMSANRSNLLADQRWAGASWNSDHGLWEPVEKMALDIRGRLGGVDVLP